MLICVQCSYTFLLIVVCSDVMFFPLILIFFPAAQRNSSQISQKRISNRVVSNTIEPSNDSQ